jgi:aminoglycoside phosphotransferase (APT) family kinase protein
MTLARGAAKSAPDLICSAPVALQDAASRSGLDGRGARLIRIFATAVYHLPSAEAVARIGLITSPSSTAQLATSVRVARWLTETGFPTVEPLQVDQPVVSHGCVVTFWRYLPQHGPAPGVAELGLLLRQLHQLDRPPVSLPSYQPLVSVRRAIDASQAINEEERAWLDARCDQLMGAYAQLSFPLATGIIHGDAWRGNLLRDGQRVVLADWDGVCTGHREIDLIPTLQAPRFGLRDEQRNAFIAAYGHDIRSWEGYPVLRDMRELSTLSAILRDAHADALAARELRVRLASLRSGDDEHWTSF